MEGSVASLVATVTAHLDPAFARAMETPHQLLPQQGRLDALCRVKTIVISGCAASRAITGTAPRLLVARTVEKAR